MTCENCGRGEGQRDRIIGDMKVIQSAEDPKWWDFETSSLVAMLAGCAAALQLGTLTAEMSGKLHGLRAELDRRIPKPKR